MRGQTGQEGKPLKQMKTRNHANANPRLYNEDERGGTINNMVRFLETS